MWFILIRRLRCIRGKAELCKQALSFDPNFDLAWETLSRFHDEERGLLAALDTLACEKTSVWLETPMTEERLFRAFQDALARMEGKRDAA